MKRTEKEAQVQMIKEKLSEAQAVILADYRGLTVEEMTELRKKVFSGRAGEEEKALFQSKTKDRINELLSRPLDEVCRVSAVERLDEQ